MSLTTVFRLCLILTVSIGVSTHSCDDLKDSDDQPALPDELILSLKKTNGVFEKALDRVATVERDSAKAIVRLNFHALITDVGMAKLAAIKTLKRVDLHHNYRPPANIEDAKLRHLGSIGSLEELNLGRCDATDEGLSHLGKLGHLRTLTLTVDKASGSGFESLSNTKSLKELRVEGKRLGSNATRSLGRLTSLRKLDLEAPNVTDADLASLEPLVHLEHFILRSKAVSGGGLRCFAKAKKLQFVMLRCPSLDDSAGTALAQLSSLEMLRIDGSEFGDAGCERLRELTGLKCLEIQSRKISDRGLSALGSLKKLDELTVSGNPITGEGFFAFAESASLTYLDAAKTTLDDRGLIQIGRLKKLQYLILDGSRITDAGLASLRDLQAMVSLSLGNTSITDAGITHLHNLKRLKSLNLQGTKVTPAGFAKIANLPKLTHVQSDRQLTPPKTSNFLRYDGFDFEVDRKQSELTASLSIQHPKEVTWNIEIVCLSSNLRDWPSAPHLEGPRFRLDDLADWRSLAGRNLNSGPDERGVFPIKLNRRARFYVGWHLTPNNHEIVFQSRKGRTFQIDWTFTASESEDDEPKQVHAFAEIDFTQVEVRSDTWGVSVNPSAAKRLVARHFSTADLANPRRENDRVIFDVLPSVK